LAELLQSVENFKGEIIWDLSKPDGTPRKLMDVTKIHNAGWKHTIGLKDGITKTYENYLSSY
jgi:GDP-L-fucose synthase